MNCPRCTGLLILERLISLDEAIVELILLRCLCGFRTDQLIARHHALPVPPEPRPDVEQAGERISRK